MALAAGQINAALLLLKGALIEVFNLRATRAVNKLKIGKNGKCGLIIGGLSEPVNESGKTEVENVMKSKIAEDVKFNAFVCERQRAEETYGELMYDNNGVRKDLKSLRLIYVPEFVIACSPAEFVSRASLIGDVKITNFDYQNETKSLEVSLLVTSEQRDLTLVQSSVLEPDMPLPPLKSVISVMSQEGMRLGESVGASDEVTPWDVVADSESGVDYDKLIDRFGCAKIDEALLTRFEKVTKVRPHRLLRRGIFFAHRDLQAILDAKEQGKPVYLYTGRGPTSSSLHLGHLIPFTFCKWLMDALDCPIVIQLTDDEKFLFKDNLTLDRCRELAIENTKDILACGFDLKRTFIFRDTDYIGQMYPTILQFQKKCTFNQMKGIFGFDDSDNIGKIAFPAVQAIPAFSCVFPGIFGEGSKPVRCLIPCAIDQDPYFRMTRDVAPRLGLLKPCEILSKFIPSLQGARTKMSGSNPASQITCSDDPKSIREKIMKYAFSGGGATIEEHRLHGANLDVDISYQYLRFFLEDDLELLQIGEKYRKGELLSGEIKSKLAEVLTDIITEHQKLRSKVTDDDIRRVFSPIRQN